MMNKNTQRIVVGIIAVILAVIMILSLVAPAMAAEGEVAEDVIQAEEVVQEDEIVQAEETEPEIEPVMTEDAADGDVAGEAVPAQEAAVTEQTEGTDAAESAASDSASDQNANVSEAGTASEISLMASQSQVIPEGVKIGAVNVSGMNREQAEAAVNAHVAAHRITLHGLFRPDG